MKLDSTQQMFEILYQCKSHTLILPNLYLLLLILFQSIKNIKIIFELSYKMSILMKNFVLK